MMRKLTLSLTFIMLLMGSLHLNAQRNCSSMHMDQIEQKDPKQAERLRAIEKFTQKYIEDVEQGRASSAVITIPIVFHVVYRTSTENISDAQIMSQLQVLNDDFRRLNSDADNTWSQAVDTEIQFCLATIDPDGNPTTGITRTQTSVNGFGTNDSVKSSSSGGKDAWPSSDYLNFWVCNIGGGILGYAQFPGGNSATDGVVNGYQYTGTIGTATSPFDLGRTATHEVGHWLNLRHIWGDGNCNADDFVSDTPASDGANYGCATGHVSCSSTDMVQNYMDYSDDACMNLFTAGQKARMQALFASGGARASILNSAACGTPAEPTCTDGVQNGNETGVDCGGDCAACPPEPTCNDGVQNGDETGVDCGGSSCAACPCTGNGVTVTINLDNYPEETTWAITNNNGATVASGGTYGSQPDGSTVVEELCLNDGCYTFTINDAYGDGICCSYGVGDYLVTDENGNTLASGGEFASSEATNFCLSNAPAPTCDDGVQNGDETGVDCGGSSCDPCYTCNDGVQNGNETGVDCGGPDCAACPPTGCTDEQIDFNDFESGWGIWNDGGSDCARFSSSYSYNSARSARLRDNSSTSKMTTDDLNLSGYDDITVDFTYIAVSMDNSNEDFWLQISTNGGTSYSTVEEWNRGDEFENGVREFDAVNIQGPFSTNTRIRFRCDASGNQDWVYIDDVLITGCYSGNFAPNDDMPELRETEEEPTLVEISELTLFPNPANDYLNVDYVTTDLAQTQLSVIDINGKVVHQQVLNENTGLQRVQIDLSRLSAGFYFVQLVAEDSMMTQKFIKQ